jgi:tRNA threonylcarbamoyl adenosine modification protein YeaZ
MLTLAINTASSVESVALISGKKLLAEKKWRSNKDESEKLLPAITALLKKSKYKFKDVKKIIVVNGPGPFSAVRIGVTVANILASSRRIPVFTVDTNTLWTNRTNNKKAILMIHAGGHFVSITIPNKKSKIAPIEDVLKDLPVTPLSFFGDITENEMRVFDESKPKSWNMIPEKKLKSFGETLLTAKLKKVDTAIPIYFRPPNITKSKK